MLTGNVANNNSRHGFVIRGGIAGTRLEGNRAQGNPRGFTLESQDGDSADGYELTGNTATNNDIGFELIQGSSDNVLTANTSQDNATGFRDTSVGGSGTAGTFNTYSNNTCSGTGLPSNPTGLC